MLFYIKNEQVAHDNSLNFEHRYVLEDGTCVCARHFAHAYGFSKRDIEDCSKALKTNPKATSIDPRKYSDSHLHNYSHDDAEDILMANLPFACKRVLLCICLTSSVSGEDHIRAAKTPSSSSQMHAVMWLNEHFKHYADHMPNEEKAYVGVYYKADLFNKYKDDMESFGVDPVKKPLFYSLWRDIFPEKLLRRKCNILGKCHLCSRIQTLRSQSKNRVTDEALRQAHFLHRGGLFMLEREQYATNIQYALKNKDTVMSIVMDGMDQSNCVLPSKGTQDSFSSPLHHKLQGVIIHGIGMRLFSSFDNVTKDTNMSLYALLSSIEFWAETHFGNYPEEVFLQIDGGPENISTEFLAMLELLVHKRLTRKIMYTRLPTGHTHCDIDGGFGHLKNFFKRHPCETLEDFVGGIKMCYEKTCLKPTLEFVNVVPDYMSFLEGCVDNIEGYAKEEKTQHRWLFEAVPVSADFPFGVRTLHRNYASDVVVEFDEIDPAICLSNVGRVTGLEPRTTYVRWFPSSQDNLSVGRSSVDGYYILKKIPYVTCDLMKPAKFELRAKDSFRDCFVEICRVWPSTSKQYASWTRWWEESCPKDGITAEEYIQKHYYRQPLLHLFKYDSHPRAPNWLSKDCYKQTVSVEAGFTWPEQLSACLNTVSTSWIRNCGPARYSLAITNELKAMISEYTEKTKPHYESLQSLRLEDLKLISRRRIDTHGGMPSMVDKKSSAIKSIKDSDYSFLKIIHRSLSEEVLHGLRTMFTENCSVDVSTTRVVSKLTIAGKTTSTTLDTFRQFSEKTDLSPSLIDFMVALFQARDERLAQTHLNVNSTKSITLSGKEVTFSLLRLTQSYHGNTTIGQSWIFSLITAFIFPCIHAMRNAGPPGAQLFLSLKRRKCFT